MIATVERVEPGIYKGMPYAEYREAPGLSYSAMKDLAVSPLRYWHLHVNPERPVEREAPHLTFGRALHCAVLEPDAFDDRYCREIDPSDYPGILITMDDLKGWLSEKGLPTTAKRKAELINRILTIDPSVPIQDALEEQHKVTNADKVELSVYDWRRVKNASTALLREPRLQQILNEKGGAAEVSIFREDPETGVLLKGRPDWITPSTIFDPKTFSQQRGKSIDKCVADAIWYEGYTRQGYFYSYLTDHTLPFVLGFVESESPHEVRLRELAPKAQGIASFYWQRAETESRALIRQYADCWRRFGSDPWREDRDVDVLVDEELPQMAY